jgi:hypothetical protein
VCSLMERTPIIGTEGDMEDSCEWVLTGTVSKSSYKTTQAQRSFWVVMIRVEKGEICLYIHDTELQKIVERVALGTRVQVNGFILPHSRVSNAEKPYFLSPSRIQILESL